MAYHVDFHYAFALPHRLTVALPDSSDKTLLDIYPEYLRMAWSTDNLMHKTPGTFLTPATDWEMLLKAELDGEALVPVRWERLDGWMPVLVYTCENSTARLRLTVAGGTSAAITRIELASLDEQAHHICLRCEKPGGWAGYNPAWVDPDAESDLLLAGWKDRADRVLILGIGADQTGAPAPSTLEMSWQVAPGETRTAWLVRPYQAYHPAAANWRSRDWGMEFEAALQAWRKLIDRAAQFTIPDIQVQNAFYAALADSFVMREPLAYGYLGATPGTEVYRAVNSFEPMLTSILMDQVGLHTEAAAGSQISIEMQGADGNWADPAGWGHLMWGASGFKSWTIMEHYRLTGDTAYLASAYPRMLASSRWQEQQRSRTRKLENGARPLTYGLMPRGMGDAGLWDGDDLYGVFLPHNIWAVYADSMTLAAAQILNKSSDLDQLRKIYAAAREDLLYAIQNGAICEEDYRWIPGVAGKTSGSRWGALNAVFPCEILPATDDLITGTIRKIETRISPGGIPIHTGWLKDGMWVAITLDNLAEVLLRRGQADEAAQYLYATLNHGTPLYSWCEERGQEAGTPECTGDRQHLWTPVAVGRFIRDALVMEEGSTLHLARGAARDWLKTGKPLVVSHACTHFGDVSYQLQYDAGLKKVVGSMAFPLTSPAAVRLYLRLPENVQAVSVNGDGAAALAPDGSCITWQSPHGECQFEVTLR
jgi:hypothetical protein